MDKDTLLSYMPNYYRTSDVANNINNANAVELTRFDSQVDNVLNQFFIDTADISLDRWEKELGITISNNYGIDYRRSVILSKLRGQGTSTVKTIKNVAQSYNNGLIDVIEHNEENYFEIIFIGNDGIPSNLSDLKNAVEQIKPAHLGIIYNFKFLIWDILDSRILTWDDLDSRALTWDIFEGEGWK